MFLHSIARLSLSDYHYTVYSSYTNLPDSSSALHTSCKNDPILSQDSLTDLCHEKNKWCNGHTPSMGKYVLIVTPLVTSNLFENSNLQPIACCEFTQTPLHTIGA